MDPTSPAHDEESLPSQHASKKPPDAKLHGIKVFPNDDGEYYPSLPDQSDLPDYEDEDEHGEATWERIAAEAQPWQHMRAADRALMAVLSITDRHKKHGQDGRLLLTIISEAIKALERAPKAHEVMQVAAEWPSFVPGGPGSGPLRRAWAKGFSKRGVGVENPSIPTSGKTDYAAGKPARLAKNCFQCLEELRLSGVIPVREEMLSAGVISEPEYQKLARRLPPLSVSTTKAWVDVALVSLEALNPDWIFWLGMLEGRQQTAKTRSQKKADKGMKYGAGSGPPLDLLVVKIVIKDALTEGFMRLATD